ncbi:hypothetical protein MNBD_NITROSPINAE02-1478 [hydrothermal vent metagenome]|uniref:Uncharacterized protein n=1 Tax=hydrothermal vent metagenome TaxID=652676 RepID=A0A3B1BW45_9ZZZZ
MIKKILTIMVVLAVSGGPAFAFETATPMPGADTLERAVADGATPEQAVAQILKKVLMCPTVVGCAEIVSTAIALYPERSASIVTAAIVTAPACEKEIVAGLDPSLLPAAAAGRRPPAQFSEVDFPDLCANCGGVTSPS